MGVFLENTVIIEKEQNSSKQIIKSTSIVGGSQVLQILLGIVRTKFVAIILSASGIGLLGLYQTTIDLIRMITSFGINFSGARDIAEAASSNDNQTISRSVLILRRWAIGTGLLGSIVMISLCVPLSKLAFNDTKYAISIAILSITLLLSSISQAQSTLLQGMRRISAMAKASLYGALFSTIIAIPLYFFLGINGIVPSLILISIITLSISWSYARKIKVDKISLTFKESFLGGINMAKFGFFIVANSLVTTLIMYLVKIFITKKIGLVGVGLYQAVWTITNTYLGVLLNSLLADFYPRLSAKNGNNFETNRLTNEQYEITLLLGFPLMILLFSLSPIVIALLYSSSFLGAVPLLQWHIIGSFLVLISWPSGVIFLAAGKGEYSFLGEMSSLAFYVLCIIIGWNSYGINILGVAYCVKAAFGILITLLLTKKLTGFIMSLKIQKIIYFYGFLMILNVVNMFYNKGIILITINCIICVSAIGFTYISLRKLLNFKNIIYKFFNKK